MNTKLTEYKKMTTFMGELLPDIYDIVLFEIENNTLKVLEQSNWSNLNTEFIRKELTTCYKKHKKTKEFPESEESIVINDNKIVKLNISYISDENQIIGLYCVALQCEMLIKNITMFQKMLNFNCNDEKNNKSVELKDIQDIVNKAREEADGDSFTVDDKKEIFIDMYDMGVFRLKGAVPEVAKALNMSEKSAYRYLAEIRKARQ